MTAPRSAGVRARDVRCSWASACPRPDHTGPRRRRHRSTSRNCRRCHAGQGRYQTAATPPFVSAVRAEDGSQSPASSARPVASRRCCWAVGWVSWLVTIRRASSRTLMLRSWDTLLRLSKAALVLMWCCAAKIPTASPMTPTPGPCPRRPAAAGTAGCALRHGWHPCRTAATGHRPPGHRPARTSPCPTPPQSAALYPRPVGDVVRQVRQALGQARQLRLATLDHAHHATPSRPCRMRRQHPPAGRQDSPESSSQRLVGGVGRCRAAAVPQAWPV
jgi:hypothetical protein